jgi:hypothetical protein
MIHTVVTSLRKDQSGKMSRLVASGSTEKDRKANDQERPAELCWPTTVTKSVGELCCYDHALAGCQLSASQVRDFIRRTTAAEP